MISSSTILFDILKITTILCFTIRTHMIIFNIEFTLFMQAQTLNLLKLKIAIVHRLT